MQKNLVYPKEHLLQVLRTNYENHEDLYEEALKEFDKAVIDRLTKALEDFKRSPTNDNVSVIVPAPEYHGDEYQRSIRMLEMTSETEIELSEVEFNRFVMDNWEWSQSFFTSTQAYVN